jgi:hypothetical protein
MQQEKDAAIADKDAVLVTKNELEAALAAKNMAMADLIEERDQY